MLDSIKNNSFFFWHLIFILDDQFLQFRFGYQDKISYQIYYVHFTLSCLLSLRLFLQSKNVFHFVLLQLPYLFSN